MTGLRLITAVILLCTATAATAGDVAELVKGHAPAMRLLTRKAITIRRQGRVHAPFARAVAIFESDENLDLIQAEYGRMLAPGKKPEFVVERCGHNVYSYVNRDGHRSTIEAIHRSSSADTFDAVFYVTGERFFGTFQALVHLHAVPTETRQADYDLTVQAYPENAMVRLVTRLSPVQHYFRRKAAAVSGMAVRITESLCRRHQDVRPTHGGASGPSSSATDAERLEEHRSAF